MNGDQAAAEAEHRRQKLLQFLSYLNISQTQFAEEIGISRAHLVQLLCGNKPVSNRTIRLICKRYGIDPAFFETEMTIDEILPLKGVDRSFNSPRLSNSTPQERIKIRRKQLNLSMRELGSRCGLNRQTICMVESGRQKFTKELADKLAPALEVPVMWLLEGTDSSIPYPITPEVLHFLENNETLRRWIWKVMESGVDLNSAIAVPTEDGNSSP